MMNDRYRYLLFDIDNTLMDFSAGEKIALFQTMEELNRPISDADHREYLAINRQAWAAFEAGELDSKAVQRVRFERFAEHLGIDPAEGGALNARYVENLGQQAVVMDGAHDLLRRLTARYQIAFITNGLTLVQRARLARSGFYAYAAHVFISQEMGVQKPEKAYFDRVQAAFQDDDPAAYLVIGDSLTADIRGGINAGMDTCWLRPAGAAQSEATQPTYIANNFEELAALLLPSGDA